jgi:hypothetical protein
LKCGSTLGQFAIRSRTPSDLPPVTRRVTRTRPSAMAVTTAPSDQLAVGSSTEQAAPPLAGRGPRPSDTPLKSDAVFGVAGLTGPGKADQAATATVASLSLEIADSSVVFSNAGKNHKRPFEFAESDDETAVGCQKRSCCSDVVINDITDDDNVDDEPTRQPHRRPVRRRTRPPRPARQTCGAQ